MVKCFAISFVVVCFGSALATIVHSLYLPDLKMPAMNSFEFLRVNCKNTWRMSV
jgi:hypothetical protein